MTPHDKPKRILALDVRPRSVGYVVFEGRDRLLDWGVHSFRNGVNAVRIPLGTKIATLLEDFRPVVVVAQKPPSREKVNRERTQEMLGLIRRKARLRGIQTHVFKRRAAVQLRKPQVPSTVRLARLWRRVRLRITALALKVFLRRQSGWKRHAELAVDMEKNGSQRK